RPSPPGWCPGGRMRKRPSLFRCTGRGHEQPKWAGRCDGCGAWNTLVEEAVGRTGGRAVRQALQTSASAPVRLSALTSGALPRWRTGLAEFDFVLGGGIVPGSVVLVGGEP